jgi:hypothetical protein
MHVSLRLLPTLGAFLVLAAPAAAQDPTVTPTATPTATPETTPTPTPTPTVTPLPTIVPTITPTPTAPAPVRARMKLRVFAPHRADGSKLAVKGEQIRIQGRIRPAVAGERAVLQLRRNGRKIVKRKHVRFHRNGRFTAHVKLRKLGKLTVRVVHRGTKAVRPFKSQRKSVTVLKPALHYGSKGPLVKLFTRGLSRMRYAVSPTSYFDDRVGRGVMAYRKVNGLARIETPTPQIVRDVLAGKGGYKVRYPGLGRHVEADLSQQILALVDDRKLVRVFHTSSGAPATPTIRGTFSFYSKTIGTNAKGMVNSNYFIRGYAIHGYASVPPYNASHGCLRIPIPDAAYVYNWIQIGDRIRVEY